MGELRQRRVIHDMENGGPREWLLLAEDRGLYDHECQLGVSCGRGPALT
jgi:hypothetical protein